MSLDNRIVDLSLTPFIIRRWFAYVLQTFIEYASIFKHPESWICIPHYKLPNLFKTPYKLYSIPPRVIGNSLSLPSGILGLKSMIHNPFFLLLLFQLILLGVFLHSLLSDITLTNVWGEDILCTLCLWD